MERICFLSDNYIDEMGGEQRVLVNIMNMLADNFEIDLYCKFRSVKKSYYQIDANINLIDMAMCPPIKTKNVFSRGMRWLNFRTAFLDCLHLKRIMKHIKFPKRIALSWIELLNNRNYKYVIGLSCFWGMFLILYGNEIEFKSFSWFHNSYNAYFESEKKYLYGYKSLLGYANEENNKLIVLTEEDRRCYVEKHQISTYVIPNPLSFECENKSSLNSKKLIFVGRLQKQQKGLDYLVEVLKIVFEKNSDWEIDIIGDGNDMSYLKQEVINNHWTDRINILGNQNNVTMYYLEASIMLLTSRWEGFGLVVTEAMECGLPVVSFATSGPSEIISDKIDGYLIEKYNVAAFADSVLNLIEHEELRRKMGINASAKAKYYSKTNIKQMWLKLLTD